MYKKLLGLLPLAGVAILGLHLSGHGRSHPVNSSTANYSHGDPSVYAPYGLFDKAHPNVIPVGVRLNGRHIVSVTADGSATHLSHPNHGLRLEYSFVPHATSFESSIVLLTPQGLEQLCPGMQRVRFTMNDGSFVDYSLVVVGRQNRTRVADARPTSTL